MEPEKLLRMPDGRMFRRDFWLEFAANRYDAALAADFEPEACFGIAVCALAMMAEEWCLDNPHWHDERFLADVVEAGIRERALAALRGRR